MFWQKSYRLEWYLIIWHCLNLYVYSISFIARHFLLWILTGVKFNFETMFQQERNHSCWILITLLNFDTFLSRNSTGRRYVDGSEFHVGLWPRVKIQRWSVTPGQNATLKCYPESKFHVELWPRVRIQHWIVIPIPSHNLTLNHDSGSRFNV